ncbi:hypothetical protein V8C42DRAFT_338586 [Trichoderma barbatum]
MDFSVVWILVLCANLGVWVIFSRSCWFKQRLEHLILVGRLSDGDSPSPTLTLSTSKALFPWLAAIVGQIRSLLIAPLRLRLASFYVKDDEQITGFNPPRVLRTFVGLLIVIQNVIAMTAVQGRGAIMSEALHLSGKLACANILPFALLAFPSLELVRLVAQPSPQIIWVHSLFGWVIWYEALLHVGISVFFLSRPQAVYILAGGSVAAILIYAAVLYALHRPECSRTRHCDPGDMRLWHTAHILLGFALAIFLIIHIWPSGPLVTAVLIALIAQVWEMLIRSPPPVADIVNLGEMSEEEQQIMGGYSLHLTRSETATSEDVPLWNKSCPDELKSQCSSMHWKSLNTTLAPDSLNHLGTINVSVPPVNVIGEDYYFEVNGVPVRTAWVERETHGKHTAALIMEKSTISQLSKESPDLQVKGPFIIPPSPYTFSPLYLDLIATDSGMLEAYSCLRWRVGIDNGRFQTKLTWFSKNAHLIHLFIDHFEQVSRCMMTKQRSRNGIHAVKQVSRRGAVEEMSRHIVIVWYGGPIPHNTHVALQESPHVDHFVALDALENILPDFMPCSKYQHVVGENLRAYQSVNMPVEIYRRTCVCCEDNQDDKWGRCCTVGSSLAEDAAQRGMGIKPRSERVYYSQGCSLSEGRLRSGFSGDTLSQC